MSSTGPSTRAICRCLNRSSCGTGTIVGNMPNGNALILSNAHVMGTQIGRTIDCYVESQRETVKAKVIRAAYSNNVIADWAIAETTQPYTKVKPVFLSKKRPTGSFYTKGFPKCRPHDGTDIKTHRVLDNGVWLWTPNSISGQSGSGVFSDIDNFIYGLLTWSWKYQGRWWGAGQITAGIYLQNRTRSLVGLPKPEGLIEVNEPSGVYDFEGLTPGDDDPVVDEGFFQESPVQTALNDLPIWAEDQKPVPPKPPGDDTPSDDALRGQLIDFFRDQEELFEKHRRLLENFTAPTGNPLFPEA